MKKSNPFKNWRLNISIIYCEQSNADRHRTITLNLLKNLALFYKLDYAISEAHPLPFLADLNKQTSDKSIVDFFYFRSYESSMIDSKRLRSIISSIFHKESSLFFQEFAIWIQPHKILLEYPFPNDFYRPLNYPLIEVHKDNRITLCISAEEVMKVIQSEQTLHLD